MERDLYQQLLNWKKSNKRKPLILKGIRQVGKTYLLQRFGNEHFSQTHYLNFEKNPKLCEIFEPNLDPNRILTDLSLHFQKRIDITSDLIIFDEIQACPKALTSLKYFCEDLPKAFVCCAGSLLDVYLGPVSYPVGKVDKLEMQPMSFREFLLAIGDGQSVALIDQMEEQTVISDFVHDHLWERLKCYFVVGGLPEVVALFRDHQEDLFTAYDRVRKKQWELIEDYYADIAKHAGEIDAMHIRRIWESVPEQLAMEQDGSARKFRFKNVIPGIDRFSKLSSAIDWLDWAGLILKVHIVQQGKMPLSAYKKENSFKLFLFDIGILGAMSNLEPKSILDYQYGSYKGFFAENYVAQALTISGFHSLFSWVGRTAEVEFVEQVNGEIIPIEVKSGWVTQSKSLRAYVEKYQPPYRVIVSAKKLSVDRENSVHHYPLYLINRFLTPSTHRR